MSEKKNLEIQLNSENVGKGALGLSLLWCALPVIVIIYCLVRGLAGDFVVPETGPYDEMDVYYPMIDFFVAIVRVAGLLSLVFGILLVHRSSSNWLRRENLRSQPWFYLLFALLLWAALSTVMAHSPLEAFVGTDVICDGYTTYLAYAGVFICGSVMRTEQTRLCLLRAFTGMVSLCALVMFLQETGNYFIIGCFPTIKAVVFENINYFAYMLCLSITLLAGLYVYESGKAWSVAYLLQFILQTVALIVNHTFGCYLAVVVALPVLFVFLAKNGRFGKRARAETGAGQERSAGQENSAVQQGRSEQEAFSTAGRKALVLAAAFVGLTVLSIFGIFGEGASVLINFGVVASDVETVVADSGEIGSIATGRGELWMQAFRRFLSYPVFGGGPDCSLANRDFPLQGPPHNDTLQVLSYLGLPGCILYYWALFSLAVRLWKRLGELSPSAVICSAGVVCYMGSAFFGHPMYCTTPYFWLILGMITLGSEADEPLLMPAEADGTELLPDEAELMPAEADETVIMSAEPEESFISAGDGTELKTRKRLNVFRAALAGFIALVLVIGIVRTGALNEQTAEVADIQAMRLAESAAAVRMEEGEITELTEFIYDPDSFVLMPYSQETLAAVSASGMGRKRVCGGKDEFLAELAYQEKLAAEAAELRKERLAERAGLFDLMSARRADVAGLRFMPEDCAGEKLYGLLCEEDENNAYEYVRLERDGFTGPVSTSLDGIRNVIEYEMSDPAGIEYDEAGDYTGKILKVTADPVNVRIDVEWI